MPITGLQATKLLCLESNWSISNLQIHKILYITHMFFMLEEKGTKLITGNSFEAWDYGPVIPSVYHRAKAFGAKPVQNVFRSINVSEVSSKIRHSLRLASKEFKDANPGWLVRLTHQNGGAWQKHYKPKTKGIIIPDSDIYDEAVRTYGDD